MHGRLKVKTTAEQQQEKMKERARKLALYRAGLDKAVEKRKNHELDQDALTATQQLLLANPDFYTLWNFRKEIILHLATIKTEDELQAAYKEELAFTEACLRINPKSYGTWHHRCWSLDTMPNPDWKDELKLCDRYLDLDERNFHCWQYRRFVALRSAVPPEDELEFTLKKIERNFSNYSAWHYRSKLLPVIHSETAKKQILPEDVHFQELELVQNAAFTDPNDQSAWFYHRWLLGRVAKPPTLSCFYANRSKRKIVLGFTGPIALSFSDVVLICDGRVFPAEWQPSLPGISSAAVWVAILPPNLIACGNACHLVVTVITDDNTCALEITLTASDDEAWSQNLHPHLFRAELSAATTAVLQQELESCEQLQELEPDSKWTLLTRVQLMRALDGHRYNEETMAALEKLTQVDVDRHNYYRDLRSKFVMENLIESLKPEDRKLAIADRQLTALYHTNHLLLITSLDVSHNQLRSLHALHPLQCLHTLHADHNLINNCNGLECLTELTNLSLSHNHLDNLQSVTPLSNCLELRILIISHNAVCSSSELLGWCQNKMPMLQEIKT